MPPIPVPLYLPLTPTHPPALSLAGIICEHYGVLCESGPWSFKTAHAYLTVIDAVSITCALPLVLRARPIDPRCLARIALYGLLIFYGLTKEELAGRKPLSKFLSIKLIVMFTFYQALVVRLLFTFKRKEQEWGADCPVLVLVFSARGQSDQGVTVLDGDKHRRWTERARDLH